MSLAEIKDAISELTPEELVELAGFIRIQEAPGLVSIPVNVANSGAWPEFPIFDGGPEDIALNHDRYLYDEHPATKSGR